MSRSTSASESVSRFAVCAWEMAFCSSIVNAAEAMKPTMTTRSSWRCMSSEISGTAEWRCESSPACIMATMPARDTAMPVQSTMGIVQARTTTTAWVTSVGCVNRMSCMCSTSATMTVAPASGQLGLRLSKT